ncbi:MAG TPA: hypothetical protein HA257_08965 [Candidatus Methanoperedenaceae archaeon]|nr:hypothetical protein [Candidatus Methanoperedenaceae archaeon]
MKKKSAEIAGTIASLALLVLMLYASGVLSPRYSHYGFAASIVLFIAVVSALGIRLAGMKDEISAQ